MEDGVVILLCDRPQSRKPPNAGIREDNMELALCALDCREEASQVVKIRHVSWYGCDISSNLFRRRGQLCFAPPGDKDVCTFFHKLLRRRKADPAIATGNQCNLPCQFHFRLLLFEF